MSDRKLLKKVRDGDKEALSDIIKQYYADIFRFCLYMIQNEEDSYDITQETFLKFMKYGTSYQRNNLKGYLLTIARNLCFDYQQRKKETGKNLRSYEAENENGSLKISDNVDKTEGSGKTDPTENADPTETPETSSEKPAADENADTDNKEDKESKSDQDNKTDTDNEENKIEEDKTDNKNNKDNNSNADKTDKDTETTGKLEPADDMTQDKEDTKKDDEDGAGDNIFDNPVLPDDKDDRPTDAEDSLSDEEKEERAALNHTCDGITVSGVNLPWYVQFRVSSGDSYQFTNESDAMIFQSYEFELWDLKNNTEYEIPNGDYISVTVPVKSGYQYTIEHLLDNGATETIIPSVENGIMVFSTHSFSPFGIAGSRQLVGPDAGNDTDDTDAVTPAPASSDSQSSDSGKNNTVSMNDSSDSNNGSSSDQNDNLTENKAVKITIQ